MANTDTITASWQGKMAFAAQVNGHTVVMDVPVANGGDDGGPRPKPLMLVALAGCTGMDVVVILQKMRVPFERLDIRVEGDLTDEHPKQYTKMRVIFEFTGRDLPLDKLQRAVSMSEERYCGVGAVYRKALEVTTEVRVIEP